MLTSAPPGPHGESYAVRWRSTIREHRALAVLLAVGLALRLALLAASASMPLQIVDEQHYADIASTLLRTGEYAFSTGERTSMRPPLYPAFVATLWAAAGTESPQVVRVAQVLLGLLVVVGTYLLALRLFDRRTAFAGAAIVCFYPSLLYAGLLVLTEVLFTVLLIGFVLIFAILHERPRPVVAVCLGAVLGAAALTRSVLWPFPIVLLPFLALTVPGAMRRRAAVVACCLAGFVLVVGPWSVRNSLLHRTFVAVDTMGGMNLRMGNYEYTLHDRMWDTVRLTGEQSWSYPLTRRPEAGEWTVGQKDRWAQREAFAYMVANPGVTLQRGVLKFTDFWGLERELVAAIATGLYSPPRWFAILASALVAVAYPTIALGATVGLFRNVSSDRQVHALIAIVVLFVTGIHMAAYGHSRYHLPLIPLLAVYAGAAWTTRSWQGLFQRSRLAAAPVTLAAVLVTIWSYQVLFRDGERIRLLMQVLL